jgi:hypothetical protein
MADEITNLETKVTVDATQAMQALNALLKSTSDYSVKVAAVSKVIQDLAQETGKSYEKVATFLRQSSAVAGTSNKVITDGLKMVRGETQRLEKDTQKLGKTSTASYNEASKAATGWQNSLKGIGQAIQTALGLGIYQIVGNLIQGFQDLIGVGIEYEKILFRLDAASELWSKKGTPFSTDEMRGLAGEITAAFPIFSEKDALEGVAGISILSRNLGLSKVETDKFFKAVSSVSVLMGKDLSEAAREAGLAISSGYSESLQKMGFNINKAVIAQRALALGFERSQGDFSQEAKAAATLSIILEQTNDVYAVALKYQETTPGKVDKAAASWNNLIVQISQMLSPAIGETAVGFDKLFVALDNILEKIEGGGGIGSNPITDFIKRFFSLNDIVNTVLQSFVLFGAGVVAVIVTVRQTLSGDLSAITGGLNRFMETYKKAFDMIKKDVLPDKPAFDADFGGAPGVLPTINPFDTEKLNSMQDELLDDMQTFRDRADKITREFYEKQTRLQEEYQKDVRRENEDYEIDRQAIINDANKKIAEAQEDFRQKEKDDEAKFQLAMKELRDKFLFDLEDALRNRDAGQVLRLIQQFKMNKEHLIDEHNLEKKQRAENFRDELADIKSQEAEKLALLAQEHALKLQRMAEDYQQQKALNAQEQEDQMNDLKLAAQRRLEEYSREVAAELGLRQGGAQAIYDLLAQYYGPQGLFDNLYDYSYASLVAKTAAMAKQMQAIYAQYAATAAAMGSTAPNITPVGGVVSGGASGKGMDAISMAKGGTIVASKPTPIIMGDAGLEIGTFRPLNAGKVSSSNIPSFSDGAAGGGVGSSKIELMLWLSPDIEAKIVNKSLDAVADVVTTVRRNRN